MNDDGALHAFAASLGYGRYITTCKDARRYLESAIGRDLKPAYIQFYQAFCPCDAPFVAPSPNPRRSRLPLSGGGGGGGSGSSSESSSTGDEDDQRTVVALA